MSGVLQFLSQVILLVTLATSRSIPIHNAYSCKTMCLDKQMSMCTSTLNTMASYCCESELECRTYFNEDYSCNYMRENDTISHYLSCPMLTDCGIQPKSQQMLSEQLCVFSGSNFTGKLIISQG